MTRLIALVLMAAALPGAAFAAIVVENPQIRATGPGQPTAAAYMVVRNTGTAPDRLLSATCACASSVMAHQTTMAGGVARMSMEEAVTIPAGGSVTFAPGGRHLMLMGVKAPIAAGSKVPMQLTFEKAGKVAATFAAVDAPTAPPASHHMHR